MKYFPVIAATLCVVLACDEMAAMASTMIRRDRERVPERRERSQMVRASSLRPQNQRWVF